MRFHFSWHLFLILFFIFNVFCILIPQFLRSKPNTALVTADMTESDISSLIFDYTSKIPYLAVSSFPSSMLAHFFSFDLFVLEMYRSVFCSDL